MSHRQAKKYYSLLLIFYSTKIAMEKKIQRWLNIYLIKTYCWYFAHILQLAFERGRVYYVHDEHYFVWRDDDFNGIMLYDINGVYHTHKILIPEDELSIEERKMLHDEAMPYANNNTTMMEKLLKRISNPQMSAISKRKGY